MRRQGRREAARRSGGAVERPSRGSAPPWSWHLRRRSPYAVEAALQQAEANNGSVTAISIGGENAKDALKHALAMGCGEAILISDPGLTQADSQMIARVLAAAIQKVGGVDLAFLGRQAIDSDTGLTAAQTARVLGWPALTLVSIIEKVDPAGGTIKVVRAIEEGRQVVKADLPAVLDEIEARLAAGGRRRD